MASGGALLPRPHAVPIRSAHVGITDNVRRTAPVDAKVPDPIPFGSVGNLDATASFPFPLPYGHTLDGAVAYLTAALTGDTVLTFSLNGSSAFTLTIPSGTTGPVTVLGEAAGTFLDILTIQATTLGTGTAVLGGHLRWLALP